MWFESLKMKLLSFCWHGTLSLDQIWITNVKLFFQVPIEWDPVDVTPVKGPDGKFRLPQKVFESMAVTKCGLKGPLATPVGKGHQSLNLALRK